MYVKAEKLKENKRATKSVLKSLLHRLKSSLTDRKSKQSFIVFYPQQNTDKIHYFQMTSPISAPSSEFLNLINLDSLYCNRRKIHSSSNNVLNNNSNSNNSNTEMISSLGLPSFYISRRKGLLLQLQQKSHQSQVKKCVHESAFYQSNRQAILHKRYGQVNQNVPVVKSASASSFSINHSTSLVSPIPLNASISTSSKKLSCNNSPATNLKVATQSISPSQSHHQSGSNYTMALSLRHHSQGITRIKFAQGEMNRFAACSSDSNISICSVEYSETLRIVECKKIILLKGHKATVSDLAWSNDNSFLVSCSSLDKTLRMWNAEKGTVIRVISTPQGVHACDLPLLNNNMVIGGTLDGNIQIINLSTGKIVNSTKISAGGGGGGTMVKCLCLSEDGFAAFIGDEIGNVHIYALDQMNISLTKLSKTTVTSNGAAVTGLAYTNQFSRDKREPCLLINGKDNHLRMFKVSDSSSSLAGVRTQSSTLSSSSSSSSSSSTVVPNSSYNNNKVKIFKLALKQVIPIKNQQSDCIQPCFAMNLGKSSSCTFASGSEDSCVHVYELPSLQTLTGSVDQQHLKLTGHGCTVLSVAFNADKSILISGDAQGTIRVWKR